MSATATSGYVPEAPKFELSDDWKIYQGRLDQFFIAYNVTDEKRQAAILQTAISNDVYRILTNLCFPNAPSSKSYKQLCELLAKHFAPVVSIFVERQKFYNAKQLESESVTDWSNRLRSLAILCDFNDTLEAVLRDKFVTGTMKGPVLDKLFELDTAKTFAECVETALQREMTTKQKSKTLEINKLHAKKNNFSHNSKSLSERQSSLSCYACGKQNHNFKTCRYKSFKCTKCNTVGHIAAVCRKNKQKNSNFLSTESANENDDDDNDYEALSLFNTDKISSNENNRFVLDLKINNVNITFEIDTGAAVSICSKKLYDQHFSSIPLKETNIVLKSYDNSVIRPCGRFVATVQYGVRKERTHL